MARADVVSAVTLLAVPGLAGLAGQNVAVLAVSVAGLLWIRRFVDDRAP